MNELVMCLRFYLLSESFICLNQVISANGLLIDAREVAI